MTDEITQSTGLPATEPLKAGDEVMVNGQPATVVKVDSSGQPEFKATAPEFKTAAPATLTLEEQRQKAWDDMVISILRTAHPEDKEVKLPTGATGHYVKFALDNQGRFAMPKPKGMRRRPHQKPKAILLGKLMQHFFGLALSAAFTKAKKDADAAGKEQPEPITHSIVQEAQKFAIAQAEKTMKKAADIERKARRDRQKTSRRINFGLVPGNTDRRSHASS